MAAVVVVIIVIVIALAGEDDVGVQLMAAGLKNCCYIGILSTNYVSFCYSLHFR